jgi:prephenate dehydrogenase
MGGSFGLALRAVGVRVMGLDSNPHSLSLALKRGAIDSGSSDPGLLASCDLTLLCVPPGRTVEVAREIFPLLRRGSLLADIAGIKAPIVEAMEALLPPSVRFLGLHPMCGTAGQGIEGARADLFHGAALVLTPTANTPSSALEQAEELARVLKMRPIRMDPEEHDRQMAALSHLPYLIAVALTRTAPGFESAGPAIRDATRVAMSPSSLWREILSLNSQNVRRALQSLQAELQRLSDLTGPDLERALEEARRTRAQWQELSADASRQTPD